MKKLISAVCVVFIWAGSAQAAVVYLKDGGTIKARNVWREKGKVVVLLNRDSITSFAAKEVNLKKTFPPRKKAVKPVVSATTSPAGVSASETFQNVTVPAPVKAPKEDKKFSLPSVPTKLPEREIPKGAEEGAIRKQKREMAERLNE